jgi:molybdopterin-containing oxidoreductase family membrane subunit
VFEIILGVVLPAVLFLTSRVQPQSCLSGDRSVFAMIGILINRWNVTVGGLFVPLSYSPGTLYQLQPGKYFPALPEWGIAIGIIGYGLAMLTLGIRYLPLFSSQEHS